jgi:hypothetical protein
MGACNKKPLQRMGDEPVFTNMENGIKSMNGNPRVKRMGTGHTDLVQRKQPSNGNPPTVNWMVGGKNQIAFEYGNSVVIEDKSSSSLDVRKISKEAISSNKALPIEKIQELSRLKDRKEIEISLLSEDTMSYLIKGHSARSMINVVNFDREEDKLRLSWEIYLKVKSEENRTDEYTRYESLITEFLRGVTRIVGVDLQRAQELDYDHLYNKEIPTRCLESMMICWHVLLSHRKATGQSPVGVWWNERKEDRKLESLLSRLIEMSGKVRYEFEVKKTYKANLLDSALSRSGSRDVAFESEFWKKRSEIKEPYTNRDIISFPEDVEENVQDEDFLRKRSEFYNYEIRTNKMEFIK